MNYATKNTFFLLAVLFLMAGGVWYRLHGYEDQKIAVLETTLSEKEQTLKEYQKMSDQFDTQMKEYLDLKEEVNSYSKLLGRAQDPDEVYSYLIDISQDTSFTFFNFTTIDSTLFEEFGILRFDISGEGYYRNVNHFINQLEYGKPLNKVRDVTIQPINELGNLGKVTFSFKVDSYYDRADMFEAYDEASPLPMPAYTYNAFYPLIHEVKPNESDLPDIEKSRLVSIGRDFVTLKDQSGKTQYIYLGDQVYLGRLIDIDFQENKAVFELNKGGIIHYITRILE